MFSALKYQKKVLFVKIKIQSINITVSTLSIILCVIGYQLATSIFLPLTSDVENISRSVTIPYRAFSLLIMLVVIMINIKRTIRPFPIPLIVLILYWFFLIVRMTSDIYITREVYVKDISQHWLYVFGICLPVLFATLKSYNYINLQKSLYWIWISLSFVLLSSLFANQLLFAETELIDRQNANVAINTISYGHLGVMGIYLSLFLLMKENSKFLFKVLLVFMIVIALYSVLRAGSRGPFVGLIIVLLFWVFAKGKNFFLGVFIILFLFALLIVFMEGILNMIGEVAPLMENRLRYTLEGDNGGRDGLYEMALNAFYQKPILGKQFAIPDPGGSPTYAHNIILDSIMALGIPGGIMMLYILYTGLKTCYYNIHSNNPNFWISLLLVHQITSNMFSGTFYQDPLLTMVLTYHFVHYRYWRQDRLIIKPI